FAAAGDFAVDRAVRTAAVVAGSRDANDRRSSANGGRHMTRITTNAGSHSPASNRAEWTRDRIGRWASLADFIELTKPRIVLLELVTVVVAAHLASPRGIDAWVLWHTVL